MNIPTPNNESELDELLRIVRDAGAEDDNYGGENWEHSDSAIQQAKQALLSWRDSAVVEARLKSAKRLKDRTTRYGDGAISYHNGEATVPISEVLKELSPSKKERHNA